jgi:hypothetical protein
MNRLLISLMACVMAILVQTPARAAEAPKLRVVGQSFELSVGGRRLTTPDLVGAELEIEDQGVPMTIRIDSFSAAPEQARLPLLSISMRRADGAWVPFCQADAKGRRLGFPVAGRWTAEGRYEKDPDAFFLTCTSGAQGKCVLLGYDPWSNGRRGEDLSLFYEACTHMIRADYDGRGAPHTRNGTMIDIYDDAGVQLTDTTMGGEYRFEAGWAPTGAACVAKTRFEGLLPLKVLLESRPNLGGPCDEAEARRRGAIVFNRSK